VAPSVFSLPTARPQRREPKRSDQRNDEENATQIDPIENAISHIITDTHTNT